MIQKGEKFLCARAVGKNLYFLCPEKFPKIYRVPRVPTPMDHWQSLGCWRKLPLKGTFTLNARQKIYVRSHFHENF